MGPFGGAGQPHIHSGTIRFMGADKLRAEWNLYAGPKKTATNVYLLARKAG